MMPSAYSWLSAPRTQNIGRNEVHVWRVCLEKGALALGRMYEILSAEERCRARSFYFDEDRARYVMARGYLRVILSRYLDAEPISLRFRQNPYGKPILVGFENEERLNFGVSHSGSLTLYAITRWRRVGIDVERVREGFSHEEVSERFFSPTERAMLRSLPVESRTKAFFECWTRKEAYVKGRGEGLTLPLEQFSVSIDPTRSAGLIENRAHPADVSLWSLAEIDPGAGYAAAVAVEGHNWSIACFDMPGSQKPDMGASRALPFPHVDQCIAR